MEPLRDRSGERALCFLARNAVTVLQWSRCVIAAESGVPGKMKLAQEHASMEPLRDRSGEPEPGATDIFAIPALLQWSRCVIAAESSVADTNLSPFGARFNGAAA